MKKHSSRTAQRSSKIFILGRAGFEKISAVEGIRFPDNLKKTFRDLDRIGASAAKRRSVIASKYGKASS